MIFYYKKHIMSKHITSKHMSKYILKNSLNHTPNTYTQGLVLYNDILYESSGLYSNSFIQKYIDPDNVIRRALPDDVFAEGICILNNILYCLTWQKSEIFALDLDFNLIYYKKFILDKCWGLTTDGKSFIVTDGSNRIYWIEPSTQTIIKTIETNYTNLNALAIKHDGPNKYYLYANIYKSNLIIMIDIDNLNISRQWDMTQIANFELNADLIDNVLNGIVHIPKTDNDFYITGKNWNKIYLVELTI